MNDVNNKTAADEAATVDAATFADSPFSIEMLDPFRNSKPGSGKGKTKPIILTRTPTGCLVPTSHKPNAYGYIGIRGARFGGEPYDYLHRIAYRLANGPDSIPPGYEIDHICRNRACCNPKHLWAISKSEHVYLTGKTRFDEEKNELAMRWLTYSRRPSPESMATVTGRSVMTTEKWLNEFIESERQDRERWAAQAGSGDDRCSGI